MQEFHVAKTKMKLLWDTYDTFSSFDNLDLDKMKL